MKNHSKQIISICAAMLISISTPLSVLAHPGRLDANGGHWNRSTGTYHYHNGSNSGSSSSSSSSSSTSSRYYRNGWQRTGNKWRYYSNGTAKTGWFKDNNCWYYCESNGDMATGWKKIADKWYYFDASGKMITEWKYIDNVWYYFDASGAMLTGWNYINNEWYYFMPDGMMLSNGWYWINGLCYYFYENGVMARNTIINGFQVDSTGAWTQNDPSTTNNLPVENWLNILNDVIDTQIELSNIMYDISVGNGTTNNSMKEVINQLKEDHDTLNKCLNEWKKYSSLNTASDYLEKAMDAMYNEINGCRKLSLDKDWDDDKISLWTETMDYIVETNNELTNVTNTLNAMN